MNAEEFKKAYRNENDPVVRARMLMVNAYLSTNANMVKTAATCMCSVGMVSKWVNICRKGGIDALRTAKRRGRTPKMPTKILKRFIIRLAKYLVTPMDPAADQVTLQEEPAHNARAQGHAPVWAEAQVVPEGA